MKTRTIGDCTLYCGDCFAILPKLDVTADAVISDPPFGITACDWDVSFSLANMMTQNINKKKQGMETGKCHLRKNTRLTGKRSDVLRSRY